MKFLIPFLICLFSFFNINAQKVQWASEVLKYSTQYGQKAYSAEQVLGKPNVLPSYGQSNVAWAPSRPNSKREYLWVKFAIPMQIQQIAVAESFNPGSIHKIYLYDEDGEEYLVFEEEFNSPIFHPFRMFRHLMPLTDYKVVSLKLEMRMHQIPSMSQIDAIGISDSKEPIEATVNTIEYENYEEFPENLGPMVNSQFDDMLPIISPDGKTLFFGRKESPQNTGKAMRDDVYFSRLNDAGRWSPAVNIGNPINNDHHNYVCAVLPDGSLVLANSYNRLGIPAQGVSIAKWNGTDWDFPQNLKIRNFINKNEFSNYHMSVDQKILLLAIETTDSYGDMDLYVSFKINENEFSEPKNLGPIINSAGVEGSVFLAADGKTIYFSTDGRAGYGTFDMFVSRRLDDTWTNWTEPVNLGEKINSRLRDVYYTVPASGDYVYYSSDKNSYGRADLYRIKLPKEVQPEPVALMQGKVVDALTNKPLDVKISYSLAREGETEKVTIEPLNGKYQIIIPKKGQHSIYANVEGYYPETNNDAASEPNELLYMDFDEKDRAEYLKREVYREVYEEIEEMPKAGIKLEPKLAEIDIKVAQKMQEKINSTDTPIDPVEQEDIKKDVEEHIKKEAAKEEKYSEVVNDIRMIPLKEGQIIKMDNIYFEANKAFLRSESHAELDKVVEFLETNKNVFIEVRGHTNGLPSHEFCNELSQNRAETVTAYLVSKGIDNNRIIFKGYGKTLPIADNSTLAGRKQNQRVEIKIMKIN